MTIRIRSFTLNYGWIVLLLLGARVGKAQVTTTTTLASVTPAAPQFGQTVTLTATVAPSAATGTVSFMDRGVLVGVGTLSAGVAQAKTLTLPAGSHTLQAVYGGQVGAYLASQSAVEPYIVTAAAGAGFSSAVNYAVGAFPEGVAVGDFNADGKADLAVANWGANNVSVLLGNGNGTFQTAVNYAVGQAPDWVAVADFNGDGKPDLAVANGNSGNNVSILLGNGDGTFQPAVNYPVGLTPNGIAIGDFNGDGKADLAVANSGSSTISVLLGNGNGTFQSAVNYATGAYPVSVATGDFNGDGKPDLAVANHNVGTVGVLLGNGNGTFQAAVNYTTGAGANFVTVGDFNGDGKPDLAVANGNSGNVSVLLGNGNGTFQTAVNYAAGADPSSVMAGDFNGDGRLDMAVANGDGDNVSVLLGNGNGTFQPAVNYAMPAGAFAVTVAMGDFNGDGTADLAVADYEISRISVLLANAPPSTSTNLLSGPNPSQFGQSVILSASVTPSAATGLVEFLNGNSVLGVGTLSSGTAALSTPLLPSGLNRIRALYNGAPGVRLPSQSNPTSQTVNPVGGLGFAPAATYGTVQSEPEYLALGDFNSDGKPDVAIADNSGWISVFLGNGNGTFQPVANYLSGGGASTLAVGDFNGDGKADLAVGGVSSTAISILLGNGNGTFQTAVAYPAGLSANSINIADFNGDGWADVAAGATNGGGNVSIMLGNGDGTLRAPLVFGPSAGLGVYGLAVGDFNGDGKPDLVGAQFGGSNLSLFLGNGDGTLQPVVNLPVGSKPLFVAVGDFNGDGKQDLAAVNNNGANMSILLGHGDGTFQPAVNYAIGSQPYSVAVGDFNADGKQDLATGNFASNNVSVLLGNGNGTFQPAVNYPGGGTASLSVAVADLNGDGRADLVFSNYNSNNIGVLLATPAPIISSISPSTVSAGETFTLTVNGSNFLSTSVPYWNTAPNVGPLPNVQFAGSTLLSATVPASYIPAGGSYPVSVATPDGGLSFFTASLPLTVGACSYALTPPSTTIPSTAGPYSVSLTATCPYSTVINGSWISITSGATGTGTGTIGYSVLANTTGSQRSGSITVLDAGGDLAAVYTITQQTPPCSSLTTTSGSFTFSSAAASGAVTLSSGCPWSAVSSDTTWLTLPASSGTGASIAFNVGANPGGQRSATITVTNSTTTSVFPAINVVQNGVVCTYGIADTTSGATSNGFSSSGGSGSLNVNAPPGCNWIATTPSGSFVSMTSSSSGSGTGTVTYSLPSGSAARSSSITITGPSYTGQVYTITEASPSTTANCIANAGVPPIARSEGATELVGDIVITCASGSAPAPGINGDVTVYFSSNGVSVPPTNQLLGSGSYTDALLLINEPSAPILNTNAFRGEVTPVPAMAGRPAGYVLLFPGVQLTPVAGGSFSNLTLRITNMRLNVSAPGVSTSITATATLPPPFACGCATQTVAFLSQGLPGENTPTSMGLTSQTSANFTVNFGEGYASAFRPRLAAGQDPSQPGTVYNAESGFVNSAALGTPTGFATTGTRLLAMFTNVPAGVTLSAAVSPVSGANAGLVAADATGNGGTFVSGTSQPIAVSAGTSTATWEVTASNPSVIETFGFIISISNPGGVNLSNMKYQTSLAPAIGLGGTSATAPIPRFAVAGTQPALANLSLAPTAGSLAGSLLAISHLGNAAAIQKSLALAQSSTIGGSVTVSELVANASSNPASNVVVGGSLPTSWAVAGCVAPDANGNCTMSGNQFTVTYPTLSPGQTATILFTGQTLTQGLSTLSFNSIVTSDTSDGSSQGAFTVTFPVPAFTIQKTHASNFTQGGTGAYSISVVNSATTSTSGQVTVTDSLPAGLTITGMSDGGAGVWACTLGTATCTTSQVLAPTLGYPPITVTVNVSPTAPANVINTAIVSGGGSQFPATALDSTNINPACSYQLNPIGASPGSGASSSSLTVTALYGCQWTATSNAPWLTVTSGSPGNGNGTVDYAVAANPGPGGRSGTLTIGGQTFTVNQATPTVPTIAKAFNPTSIPPGGTSAVTLTLSNASASALTGGAFTDTLTNMSAAGGGVTGTCSGTSPSTLTASATSLSFSGITIPASGSCTVVFSVTSSTLGGQPNTTSGVTTTQTPTAGPASNTATLTVLSAPSISKAFNPTSIVSGASSVVTLTLINNNASALTGGAFADTLASMSALGGAVGGSCAGTTPSSLTAGSTALNFAGITIPASGSCTVTFSVTSGTTGGHQNATSGVATTQTPGAGPASNTATLTVTTGTSPTISKAFNPTSIAVGGTSVVTLTVANSSGSVLTGGAFTDTLLNMSTSGGAVTGTCTGTSPSTLTAGATSLSFSGISIPASGSCTVIISVTSSTSGAQPNTASGVTTAQTPTAGSPSNTATLTVLSTPTITKVFNPTSIAPTGTSIVTLTLLNSNSSALTGGAFSDTLTNMSAAGGPVTGTCGTTPSNLTAGATALTFSGITIPASGGCTVIFSVTSSALGGHTNTTSGLTTTQTPAAGAPSNTATLTVAPPTITRISPSTVNAAQTFTLTVIGSNFVSNSMPYWNTAPNVGVLPNAQFGGSTLLTATVPASYIQAGGSYNVSVSTGGAMSNSVPLTVLACSYVLTPSSVQIAAAGGPSTVPLTATCPYSTVSNNPWITITSGESGTGSGTIGYSVSVNSTGSQRTGTFSVLDANGLLAATFTITQQTPPCASMTITSGSFTFGSGAASSAVTLSSSCLWSAVSSDPTWLTFNGTSGTANGTGSSIPFQVKPNSGGQRSATITVTNGATTSVFPAINVVQNGLVCSYSIADTISGATSNGFSSSQGSGSLNVTAPPGCNWVATTTAGSFVSLTGSTSGNGNGIVSYALGSSSVARSSSITITGQVAGQIYAGQVYTITQTSPATGASCVANAGVPPIVRTEGVTELVGDIVILCASGSAPAGGINGDVTVYFSSNGVNVTPTNELIGSGSYTDALLLINEPSTPVLNTNAFRGEVTPVPVMAGRPAGYVLLFPGVQLTPVAGGSFSNLTLRITNLRLNVSALAAGSASITATATLPPPFACACATQTVAFLSQGLLNENTPTSMGLVSQTSTNFPVNFVEGFAGAFRPRLATGQDPSQPGAIYNSESGFVNSTGLGTQTGFATTGTRLLATFTGVPAGVTLSAPVTVPAANAGLVAADSSGNGGTFEAGTSQPIPITAGTGFATWEVTASNPPFGFTIAISNPGGMNLSGMKYQISLAPAIGKGGTSATAPIPRFAVAGAQPALGNLSLAPTAGTLAGSLLQIAHLGNAAAIQKTLAASGSTIGGSVTESELLANDSGTAANNIVVGGSYPYSWTLTGCVAPDANGSCTVSGNQFTAAYPTLSPGQTATIIVTGQTLLTDLSAVSINSIVTSDLPDCSTPGPDCAVQGSFTVTLPVPSLAIEVNTVNQFNQGQTGAQYRLSVTNTATTSTSGLVTVTDTLPTWLTMTAISDGGAGVWACRLSTATCTTNQVIMGGLGYPDILVTVNVAPNAPANVINTATVSGGGSPVPATGLSVVNILPLCSYQLSATSASGVAAASNGSVNVTALYGCQWTAASNVSWLTVTGGTPGNGNGTVSYSVAANPGPGGRSGTLTIGGQQFTVNQAPVTMSLSLATLNFGVSGGTVTGLQFVTVSFAGAPLAWTASSNQANVHVSPTSGTGLGMLTITASAGPGATITVTAPGASNSPLSITVNVANVAPGNPFGSFDTPSNGATGISGSIAVTGWALDNIEVTGLNIMREPVAGEPASPPLILVGAATFVVGARPDVQALYPSTPFNYQAGWGYLLLTNELPNNGGAAGPGNGTYKLHAIATNKSGASMDLGTKTITVNNAAATLPFGAIDTPGQGATVSGTVANFGWGLTPPTAGCPAADQPCIIPVNGATIFVYVDGVALGNPVYNLARCDVDQLFPGYANSGSTNCALNGTSPGPVGYFNLDTAQLTDGVHTISWSVTDNAGRAQGIGSRYFTVEN